MPDLSVLDQVEDGLEDLPDTGDPHPLHVNEIALAHLGQDAHHLGAVGVDGHLLDRLGFNVSDPGHCCGPERFTAALDPGVRLFHDFECGHVPFLPLNSGGRLDK